MIRLAQLSDSTGRRHVAIVEEPNLHLLAGFTSIRALAEEAIKGNQSIEALIASEARSRVLEYEPIYRGESPWSLLSPFNAPAEPWRCFVTGTGLTHKASAENRQSMHSSTPGQSASDAPDSAPVTDSIRMYRIGLEGGRPQPGSIGASPEWFYKGTGQILRAHNEPLDVPNHGDDGGEEAEIAGCYLIAPDGTPHRVGLVQSNEFSDHVLEAKNYLYLAQSKLRGCSLGPEIVIGTDLSKEIRGGASIERGGRTIWSGPLASGEPWMCHTLANLEHHHFKHAEHRRPGDAHVHFFGADLFSFKDRLLLQDGDVMVVAFEGFGRPLRNPIRIDRSQQTFVPVKAL